LLSLYCNLNSRLASKPSGFGKTQIG